MGPSSARGRATGSPQHRDGRHQLSLIALLVLWWALWTAGTWTQFVAQRFRLPERVTFLWTPDGRPWLTAPPHTLVIVVLAVVAVVTLPAALTASLLRHDLPWRHSNAAIAGLTPAVLCGLVTSVITAHIDVVRIDRVHADRLGTTLAVLIGLLAGAIAALIVAHPRARANTGQMSAELPDRVPSSWESRAAGVPVSTFVWPALLSGVALATAVAQLCAAVPVAVLVLASVLLLVGVRRRRPVVRIDADGFTLFTGRRRRVHVAPQQVAGVDVIGAHPLRDFGGWGMRVGRGGRIGWVSRRGPALRIRRTYGGDVVVTLDHPALPAAVLAAVVAAADAPDKLEAQEQSAGALPPGEPSTDTDADARQLTT